MNAFKNGLLSANVGVFAHTLSVFDLQTPMCKYLYCWSSHLSVLPSSAHFCQEMIRNGLLRVSQLGHGVVHRASVIAGL